MVYLGVDSGSLVDHLGICKISMRLKLERGNVGLLRHTGPSQPSRLNLGQTARPIRP